MRQECWDIIVIGAGASGCMAAITAARQGAHVLLLEKTDKIAKKIPATGNGKCNFTNERMSPEMFRGNRPLVDAVLMQFGLEDTLSFFHEIGILPYCKNGYYYPNSRTASSVRNALETGLSASGVYSRTCIRITNLIPPAYKETESDCDITGSGNEEYAVVHNKVFFEIRTDQGSFYSKTLVLATGLLASPKLGSDGSAFSLIRKLGHHFTPIAPALCGFAAKGMNFHRIAGVRTYAKVTLYIDDKEIAEDTGELQLTDYGVSGIPVFQISRYASLALQNEQKAELAIDFLPRLTEEEVRMEVMTRFQLSDNYAKKQAHLREPSERQEQVRNLSANQDNRRNVLTQMNGLLHEKLLPVLLSLAGINSVDPVSSISEHKQLKLCKLLKDCRVTLTAPRDYEFAQVCTGGICTEEVVPETLESRLVTGLYFAGELLDVDGPCGGYNLQWAWSSGYVAGQSAAEGIKS